MLTIDFFEPLLGRAFGLFEKLNCIGRYSLLIDSTLLETQLATVGDGLGLPLEIAKFMVLIFLAFPMAAILAKIRNKNTKHLYSFMGGLLMLQWLYGEDWIHPMISSSITYLLCVCVRGKFMPVAVFVWVMGYMTMSHGYRMYVSYHSGLLDYTGTQMVLTMKLTSFAYNLHDGTFDREMVMSTTHSDKRTERVYSDRRKFAITSRPNLLEFLGYTFCFTCILAGPAFEYSDYISIIDGSAFEKKGEKAAQPSSFIPAMKNLLVSLLCIFGHLYLSGFVSSSMLFNQDWINTTPWFLRVPYFWVTEFMERCKYYFVWKAAEGASVLAGFGFEGFLPNGDVKGWGGVCNVDIVEVETAPNLQTMVRSWNKRTQGWLERYTYCRMGNSLVATYFVSALWHGLYPGYFMFFLSVPILTSIERLMRLKINPLVIPGYDGRNDDTAPKSITTTVYWVVCWFGSSLSLNYIAQVFAQQTQTGERAMIVWGSYYHIPHIIFVCVYVFLLIFPPPKKIETAEKKKK